MFLRKVYSGVNNQNFVFVWAGGEYLRVMKINFIDRVGLEMIADFRVGTWLAIYQAFYNIFPGLSDVKEPHKQLSRYAMKSAIISNPTLPTKQFFIIHKYWLPALIKSCNFLSCNMIILLFEPRLYTFVYFHDDNTILVPLYEL